MATRKSTIKPAVKPAAVPLPTSVKDADLEYPSYKSKDRVVATFDLWHTTSMGWVIPTLLIRRTRRMDRSDRTYATTLDARPVRVGLGPHIDRKVTVYVRESRQAALQSLLDLKDRGEVTSNEIRDRISSRRAQGSLNRANGLTHWSW